MITFQSTPGEDTISFNSANPGCNFSTGSFDWYADDNWETETKNIFSTPNLISNKLSEGVSDNVYAPAHYTKNEDIECIEAIKAALGTEKFRGYCQGNVIKYVWRADHKNDTLEDLKKSRWYLDRLIASHENN